MSETLPFFAKARSFKGAYRVPGGELLWLEIEGHGTVGVRSREAYLHTDGTLEPGILDSPIRTAISFTRFPAVTTVALLRLASGQFLHARCSSGFAGTPVDYPAADVEYLKPCGVCGQRFTVERPLRVRPVVCRTCGDTGVGSDYSTAGTDECEGCNGYGHEKNLHLCSECGEYSREVLAVHPRATLNHELLLPRCHASCAVESLLAELPFRFPSPAALETAGLCQYCLTVGERA